jgi:hypothetical protein
MSNFVDFPGHIGVYRYFYLAPGMIPRVGGNYMMVASTNAGLVPLYVGISDDLFGRLANHPDWPSAQRLGAKYIMAHLQQDVIARQVEEQDLIAYWNPPLNVQYRTAGRQGGAA